MPMVVETIAPQFTVPDVVRTAEYYRDVLGFEILGYWRYPPVFAIVRRDSVEIHFNRAADDTLPRTGRTAGGYDAYLRVSDLDSFVAELDRRGGEIIEGPVQREYGMRELVVRDCNGLVLAFGEQPAKRK